MRKLNLISSISLLLLFVAGCFVSSCQRETDAVLTSKQSQVSTNIVDPCSTCQYEDLFKTAGNDNTAVGTVAVCQTSTTLTITFTVSGNRERAWFNQTGIAINPDGTGFQTLNPGLVEKTNTHGDKLRSFTYTIPLSEIIKTGGSQVMPNDLICIAAYAVVPGPDGAGGQVWAGTQKTSAGNPHPRYFCYTIKQCETPEPPDGNCTFTQGYWFAKPSGQQWPQPSISFGGQTYTYSEARAIFFGSNAKTGKTDAKQAFLQGLATKLSIAGGADLASISDPSEPCYGSTQALADIETYFAAFGYKPTATSINTNTFNKTSSGGITRTRIREAAGKLSTCLNANHCDNTPSN